MRALLALALVALLPAVAFADDGAVCAAQTDGLECMTMTGNGHHCQWSASQQICQRDTCILNADSSSCVAAGCFPTGFVQGAIACVSPYMLCNEIGTESMCGSSGLCAWRDGYCASTLEPRIGKTDAECDLKFPDWSVALIIIWVCLMGILGFILFLVVSKGKQQNIKQVERSEVVVDSVHLQDNFQLAQPLNAQATVSRVEDV